MCIESGEKNYKQVYAVTYLWYLFFTVSVLTGILKKNFIILDEIVYKNYMYKNVLILTIVYTIMDFFITDLFVINVQLAIKVYYIYYIQRLQAYTKDLVCCVSFII